MSGQMNRRSTDSLDYDPTHWAAASAQVAAKAFTRLFGRDVMLYTGGVSFFALLAAFPALAILLGVYSLLSTPDAAAAQAGAIAQLLPPSAQDLFQTELIRLARTPTAVVSTQSGAALLVAIYATHRGFKALIAGLSFIHDEDRPRGFVGFNVLAFVALLVAFALLGMLSGLFLVVRLAATTLHLEPFRGLEWWASDWLWASIGLTLGLTLVYRYAMSSEPVDWRASAIGAAAATALSLIASWASALYVQQFAHVGATYGSVAAVVVMLIWLSWNVNAVFYGGALATEVEIRVDERNGKPAPARPRVRRRKAPS
jgi:membrane protein